MKHKDSVPKSVDSVVIARSVRPHHGASKILHILQKSQNRLLA